MRITTRASSSCTSSRNSTSTIRTGPSGPIRLAAGRRRSSFSTRTAGVALPFQLHGLRCMHHLRCGGARVASVLQRACGRGLQHSQLRYSAARGDRARLCDSWRDLGMRGCEIPDGMTIGIDRCCRLEPFPRHDKGVVVGDSRHVARSRMSTSRAGAASGEYTLDLSSIAAARVCCFIWGSLEGALGRSGRGLHRLAGIGGLLRVAGYAGRTDRLRRLAVLGTLGFRGQSGFIDSAEWPIRIPVTMPRFSKRRNTGSTTMPVRSVELRARRRAMVELAAELRDRVPDASGPPRQQ